MFDVKRNFDRRTLFEGKSEYEIVQRYRNTYHLGDDIGIEQVKKHAALEGELTDELLATSRETRAETFSNAYSRLYSELPWLAGTGTHSGAEQWAALIGPNASVYEVGSGAGYLINYLSERGRNCIGTDLASERTGASNLKHSINSRVVWGVTDGVNLSRFVDGQRFDYVISDQVVEHLHPDDIITHFSEARKLLKSNGEYIVRTPYALFGPGDLSAVFDEPEPLFMHLHEFLYSEISHLKSVCGYSGVKAIFKIPGTPIIYRSDLYMRYLLLFDRIKITRYMKTVGRYFLLSRAIWVVFER